MGCRDDPKDPTRGEANLGGYCNKELDALTDKVLLETDTAKRDQLIKQAFEIGIKDYGYIPLHQQALAWGVSKKVKLTQRADNAGSALLGDQTGIERLRYTRSRWLRASGTFRFGVRDDARRILKRSERITCSLSLFAARSRPSAS